MNYQFFLRIYKKKLRILEFFVNILNLVNDTWIDTIMTVAKNYDRMLPTFPSRHEIISVTIDTFYPSSDVKMVYRAFNKITAHDFNSHLSNLNW